MKGVVVLMFNTANEKDFAIVMLVEELSNSDVSYLKSKFGESKMFVEDGVWSDEYKVVYVLSSLVGLEDKERFLRILGMLEKYLRYARKGKIYNFSEYKAKVLENEKI